MEGKGPWTGRDLAACECSQEGEDQPHDQLHGLRSFCPRRGWAEYEIGLRVRGQLTDWAQREASPPE